MVEDIRVRPEDAVGQPILPHVLPDVLDRVQLRAFWRQRHQRDVGGEREFVRQVPSGLIEQQHGMGSRRYRAGDLGQMQAHRRGVAAWQDKGRAFALLGTDRAENIGRGGALIARGGGAGSPPRPSARDLVLLPDARLVGKPHLYRLAGRIALPDRRQARGKLFLKAASAAGFWA
jgi:hypothetical protein